MKNKTYSRPAINNIFNFGDVLLSYSLLCAFLLVSLVTVLEISANEYDFSRLGEIPLLFLFALILMPLQVNINPNWKTQEGKIYARYYTFFFRWIEISKANCSSIRRTNNITNPKYEYWIVSLQKLTIWHNLIGLLFGNGWKPGILISSEQNDYQELVEMIEKLC